MIIDPTSSSNTAGTASLPGTAGTASRDQFLKLFVAQLEHQNPLDPKDGADMVAQLAQFSSVEQAVETNQRLADLISAQDAAGSAGLAQLVGRDVTADASTLQLDGGAPPPMQLACDAPIAGGQVVIKNASGAVVRTIDVGAGGAGGTVAVPWDGTDAHGAPLPAGSYTVEVTAHAADGSAVGARPQVHGRVDSIELGAAGPRLHIGHARISPAAVTTIA